MTISATETPAIATLGELRASGHELKPLRVELRDNLLALLRDGVDPWPGLHGFSDTVIPQLERALIAGHDLVLLGERGQGKTRLLRALVGLLDEWTPVISGSELGEHPYDPITIGSKQSLATYGDDLRISWRHRDERYAEKLATPDTSVADLIGDVDPMKVAEGRSLGDPETIHFGLIPRSHRGIVAINELPDLAERIQVAMLNVMEERDIQIRGYVLRLPLDVLVVASANPEDYTNRGRIITPLKDRFGAEIRTHYPLEIVDEIAVIRQEADLVAEVPDVLVEILARFTRNLRESSAVDQRSGVSARFAIAGAETIAAAALHRATVNKEGLAVARVVDLETAVEVLGGKIEFETGEEGRESEVLTHLLRTAIAEAVRGHFRGLDLGLLVEAVEDGATISTRAQTTAIQFLSGFPCSASPRSTTTSASGSAPATTGSGRAPSSSRSRGSTSPAGSARRPTVGRPSMADLRPGTPSDVAGLRALGEAVVPATYDPIDAAYGQHMLDEWWSIERLGAFLEAIPHVVAEEDGRIVGVANLGPKDDRSVMWKLYVHPDVQGSGVGTALLDAIIDLNGDRPLWLERIDGNDKVAKFYAARGFVEAETVANEPWPDDIWMRREP